MWSLQEVDCGNKVKVPEDVQYYYVFQFFARRGKDTKVIPTFAAWSRFYDLILSSNS